jgi:hypothetical protein
VVPARLRALVDEWRSAGSPEQDGIPWPQQRWAARFPVHAESFEALPARLDRTVVRRACQDAAASPVAAERAFLAVMAWGHGKVGYGPYRVWRVLEATRDAGPVLQSAAGELASGGPVRAYVRLGDRGAARLPGLGPAFGTKFLYFCSPPGNCPALILDRLVARWLSQHADLRLNQIPWSASTYLRYLTAMSGWADEMALPADELEACIFMAATAGTGGQWAQRQSQASRAAS